MGVVLREDSLATLGAVHLGAMRQHDRKAVLLHRDGERWEETPDWRLDRHVIRLGLYLRERAGVEPGQRVIVASPLRREWLLADLAAVVQGAVAVALDPGLALPELALALTRAAPRAVFVSGEPMLDQLRRAWRDGGFPSLASVISFDGPLDGAAALSEVLDLGGTLDTAERAVAFRARAREVTPTDCALEYVERSGDGSASFGSLTHGEAVGYLRALWSGEPARKGDLAYVSGDAVSTGLRLALHAFAGDGTTTLAFGSAGQEDVEIAALRPHKIVAPASALEAAMARDAARGTGPSGLRGWLDHALTWIPLYRPRGGEESRGALGGRARWIRSTAALSAPAARLSRGTAIPGPGAEVLRGGVA